MRNNRGSGGNTVSDGKLSRKGAAQDHRTPRRKEGARIAACNGADVWHLLVGAGNSQEAHGHAHQWGR